MINVLLLTAILCNNTRWQMARNSAQRCHCLAV